MSSEQPFNMLGNGHDGSGRWESFLTDARDGSREAQAQLLEEVRPYLLAVAEGELASDLRPKLAASDVVQNTVCQAWQDFGDFRGQSRAELVGWLRTILCRCVADDARHYRDTAKRDVSRERSLEQIASGYEAALADSCTSPSVQMMASEDHRRFERAVRRLSSRHEQAIRLRSNLGLSFAEIGLALSCSNNAAKKLWIRAVAELGRELNREDT